jgi:hypothetical protein
MKLRNDELVFLSVWACEEQEPACYGLPAHRMQLANGVSGAHLIALIKAWTEAEGKKDLEILDVAAESQLRWPWNSPADFRDRIAEAASMAAAPSRIGENFVRQS